MYLDQYIKEQEFDVFHTESEGDLDVIKIPLPKLDEWYSKQLGRPVSWEEAITFIDGYGLPAKEQKFHHQVMPKKLKNIHSIVFEKLKEISAAKYKTIKDVGHEDLYHELEMNRDHYKDEIRWIKLQIKRRYVGYWFFNNGQPTFLNGPNYFFINFWKVDNEGRNDNLPDYRDYQRAMFNMFHFAHTTTVAYFKHRLFWRTKEGKKDEKFFNDFNALRKHIVDNKPSWETHGIERDIGFPREMGQRTINGVNFVSGRRVAKTAIACCYCFCGVTSAPGQNFFIQAMNEDQAEEKVFVLQIQVPFTQLPFFFQPFYRGRIEAKSGLSFLYEGQMGFQSRAGLVAEEMNCHIKPLPNTEKAADGNHIEYIYRDEPAKKADEGAKEINLLAWWFNTIRAATEKGNRISGFCVMPSTVGKMDTGGGSQFLELVKKSHFGDRNDNGRTPSGLMNLFLSAYYAHPDLIDEYGKTIMYDPPEPVKTNKGDLVTQGSITTINNEIAYFEQNEMHDELTQFLQNFPPDFKSAFSLSPKGMGMPVAKMRQRIGDLKYDRKGMVKRVRVNLKWSDGFGSDVNVEEHPEGKWVMCYLPDVHRRNKKTIVSEEDGYIKGNGDIIYAPDTSLSNKFFIPVDPVKFNTRNLVGKGKGRSEFAAGVFYKRDKENDPDTKPREEWDSNDMTMFLLERTEMREVGWEEILKCAILHGGHVYPEWPDAHDLVEWFRANGYDGYLLKDMDADGKIAEHCGVKATADNIGLMIVEVADFFDKNVRHMKLFEVIEDWYQMRGRDDLTNHDLAAIFGWGLRASRSRLPEMIMEMYKPVTIDLDVPTYDTR